VLCLSACGNKQKESSAQADASSSTAEPAPSGEGPSGPKLRPLSALEVDHGELDEKSPDGAPKLAATTIATTIYKLPNVGARRLGYIRLGGIVARDAEPVRGQGCKGKWYRVYPMGFVCTDEATTDLEDPLVRASSRRPDLTKPLPYPYGFVRATAPQYLRVPTKKAQLEAEFQLEEHMTWYAENAAEVQKVIIGANDVALDARGIAGPGVKPKVGYRPATELSIDELFGAAKANETPPFWLEGGKRLVPNVADFKVPEYAWFADRVRRKTGLSFVGAFDAKDEDLDRHFGITVDLRLIPTTKVKPDTGSPFHGIEITEGMHLPMAWVTAQNATTFQLIKGKDEARAAEQVPHRVLVPLSGNARIKAGKRFYQTLKDKTRWLKAEDLGIVHPPDEWPEPAQKGQKWIDISIGQQVLTLYEGKQAKYATLISSGRDRFGDPEKDLTTPLGDFRLQSKHIAAAMDSEENSTVAGGQRSHGSGLDDEARATVERIKKEKAAGKKLSTEDERRYQNIQKGRHPEYGVTRRRGAAGFELRDVPWIQYFSKGFALHGAYWHDVFGVPRSHGCVNLAPIDARIVFNFTDPPVPEGWHGLTIGDDMGEGTWVHIRK
jgi:lipoprotein-anchoring transpeptidase ErfK/SrfK